MQFHVRVTDRRTPYPNGGERGPSRDRIGSAIEDALVLSRRNQELVYEIRPSEPYEDVLCVAMAGELRMPRGLAPATVQDLVVHVGATSPVNFESLRKALFIPDSLTKPFADFVRELDRRQVLLFATERGIVSRWSQSPADVAEQCRRAGVDMSKTILSLL
jgi:hypothetical protein